MIYIRINLNHMKKIFTLLFLITILVITTQTVSSSSGGPPGAYNNAPGLGNCTSCHGGSSLQTSGTVHNSLTLATSTSIGNLQPNTTYTFTLGFADPSSTKYGFQLSVLPTGATSTSASIGTITNTSSQTQLNTRGNRTYIEHNSNGTSAPSSSKTWQFNYTTPSTVSSPVFYVVVNSTDDNFSSSGDVIYAKTFTSTVLPVKWGDITVDTRSTPTLKWVTYTEINNAFFTVEQSNDGLTWEELEEVKGAGNSKNTNTYKYELANTLEATYYRVKQTDFNGLSSYSPIVFTDAKLAPLTEIAYAITEKEILLPNLNFEKITLMNLNGNNMDINLTQKNGLHAIATSHLKTGIYLLTLTVNQTTKTHKVMVY